MKQNRKSLKSLKKFFFAIVSVLEVLIICAVTFIGAAFMNISVLGVDVMGTQESENDALAALFAFIAFAICIFGFFLGFWTYEKLEEKYC